MIATSFVGRSVFSMLGKTCVWPKHRSKRASGSTSSWFALPIAACRSTSTANRGGGCFMPLALSVEEINANR